MGHSRISAVDPINNVVQDLSSCSIKTLLHLVHSDLARTHQGVQTHVSLHMLDAETDLLDVISDI